MVVIVVMVLVAKKPERSTVRFPMWALPSIHLPTPSFLFNLVRKATLLSCRA